MKIVTANRLTDGVVVYRDPSGAWTHQIDRAERLAPDAANVALSAAQAQSRVVVGAYLIEIDGAAFEKRERHRETIRARGPSVGNSLVAEKRLKTGRA